jgi:predicted acylesterase/phospholipase RssA
VPSQRPPAPDHATLTIIPLTLSLTRTAQARATSAAPTYFRPHEVDGHYYVDGGLVGNNPVLAALTEAVALYGDIAQVGMLVSVGTGKRVYVAPPPPHVHARTHVHLTTNLPNNHTPQQSHNAIAPVSVMVPT